MWLRFCQSVPEETHYPVVRISFGNPLVEGQIVVKQRLYQADEGILNNVMDYDLLL